MHESVNLEIADIKNDCGPLDMMRATIQELHATIQELDATIQELDATIQVITAAIQEFNWLC